MSIWDNTYLGTIWDDWRKKATDWKDEKTIANRKEFEKKFNI